jgi:hypothetical protein
MIMYNNRFKEKKEKERKKEKKKKYIYLQASQGHQQSARSQWGHEEPRQTDVVYEDRLSRRGTTGRSPDQQIESR